MVQGSLLEFARKMNELMPAVIQGFARRQADELYKGKITLPQFLALDFLNRRGECKMTDMAHFMQVTTAAVTGTVDRLVRDGYVVRVYDPDDRRIIRIKLTAKGMELVTRINQQRRRMLIKIFGKLSEAERKEHLRLLMRIHGILSEKRA